MSTSELVVEIWKLVGWKLGKRKLTSFIPTDVLSILWIHHITFLNIIVMFLTYERSSIIHHMLELLDKFRHYMSSVFKICFTQRTNEISIEDSVILVNVSFSSFGLEGMKVLLYQK